MRSCRLTAFVGLVFGNSSLDLSFMFDSPSEENARQIRWHLGFEGFDDIIVPQDIATIHHHTVQNKGPLFSCFGFRTLQYPDASGRPGWLESTLQLFHNALKAGEYSSEMLIFE